MKSEIYNEALRLHDKYKFIPLDMVIHYDDEEKRWRKHPITKEWQNITIEDWKIKFDKKSKNLGLLTGKLGGMMVIDVDNKYDTIELWNEQLKKHGGINTLTLKTPSGGYHYYFLYDERIKTAKNILQLNGKVLNIDARNDGGCVATAPSSYDGKKYEWLNDEDLKTMPEWIYKMMRPRNEINKNLGYGNKQKKEEKKVRLSYLLKNEEPMVVVKYIHDKLKNILFYSNISHKFYIFDDITTTWKEDDMPFSLLISIISMFIGKELKEELTNLKIEHVNNNDDEEEEDEKKKLQKHMTALIRMINTLTRKRYINELIDFLKVTFIDDEKYKLLDEKLELVSFKNGVYDLKQKKFRERKQDDYITNSLSYDYSDDINETYMEEIKTFIKRIANNNDSMYDSIMRYAGYIITGNTKEQLFLLMVGISASNGKSTFSNALLSSMEFYGVRLNSRTFERSNTKQHKQFSRVIKPVRFCFIEEMDNTSMDTTMLKSFMDGMIGGNEILFKTSEDIKTHAKIIFTSNHEPVFKNDEGMRRRGLMFNNRSRFLTDDKYKEHKTEELVFKADKTISTKFEDEKYKLTFMQLLLQYGKKYYDDGLKLNKQLKDDFNDVCDINDAMQLFIDDYIIRTDNDEDRINKDDFVAIYNEHMHGHYQFKNLLTDIKKAGIKYDRGKRENTHGDGEGRRGVLLCVKFNDKALEKKNEHNNRRENSLNKTVMIDGKIVNDKDDPFERGVISMGGVFDDD